MLKKRRGGKDCLDYKNFWATPLPLLLDSALKNTFFHGVLQIHCGIPLYTLAYPNAEQWASHTKISSHDDSPFSFHRKIWWHTDKDIIFLISINLLIIWWSTQTMIWWHGWVLLSFFGRMSTLWSHWFDRICSGTKYSNQIWDGSINPSSLYKSGGHLEDRETYFNIWKWN